MSRPNTILKSSLDYLDQKSKQTLRRMKARFMDLPFDPCPLFDNFVPPRAQELVETLRSDFNIDTELDKTTRIAFSCNGIKRNAVSRSVSLTLPKQVWCPPRFQGHRGSSSLAKDAGPHFAEAGELVEKLAGTLIDVQLMLERTHRCLDKTARTCTSSAQLYQYFADVDFVLDAEAIYRGQERSPCSDLPFKRKITGDMPDEQVEALERHNRQPRTIPFTVDDFKAAKGTLLMASLFPEGKEPCMWPIERY